MIEKANSFYSARDYDVPFTRRITKQKLYAKALYDNIADTPDELAFKKGETLTIIEQDTDGLEGWWLCSLRGRQGICPGNRLRIINSYDSGCFSPSPSSSPCPSLAASTATLNSSILSSEIYENSSIISSSQQQLSSLHSLNSNEGNSNSSSCGSGSGGSTGQGKRRSWHITPHKVITPQRCGDVYLYDLGSPSSRCSNSSTYQNFSLITDSSDTYDVPKPATPVNYDCPKNWCRVPPIKSDNMATALPSTKGCSTPLPSHQEEAYDIPKPISLLHQQNMTPSSSNSSLLTSDSLSLSFSSSNRSSLANMPDYDIPRRVPIPVRATTASANHYHPNSQIAFSQSQNHQQHHAQSTYDFPQPHPQSSTHHLAMKMEKTLSLKPLPLVTKELPLELSSAMETLAKLQSEATYAISRLLAFVTPDWRTRAKLEPNLMDIKLAAVRLRTALHDLTEFSEGALGNATRADDKNLALKLRHLVKALRDADKLIHDTSQMLDIQGWSADVLARDGAKATPNSPDSLDQMIACAQTLTEDVRQSTSFIHGNAPLLFKRTAETPTPTGAAGEWLQDYDYVSFESKDVTAKKNSELRAAIPQNLQKKFDNVIKTAEAAAVSAPVPFELSPNDKLVVKYYALQISTHMGHLTQAIDSFLEAVEKNQPPKFFIAYGKFVVLSAHNLVSIGDIVHRNLSRQELKDRVEKCTDALSDALKTCVAKSKKAAQQFPSVTAVQEMVDSVVDISHLASELKIEMLRMVHEHILMGQTVPPAGN